MDNGDSHLFHFEAMATSFRLVVAHPDPVYARQAAAEAFGELDRIERILSRFIEGGDISRINRLRAGSSVVVDEATFACLRTAVDVQRATGGAFDAAYRSARPAGGQIAFELDGSRGAVRILRDGVQLDLGGIGKGFALDRLAAVLAEWDIESALLCASDSTVLAFGSPGGIQWTVSLGSDGTPVRRRLASGGFSASGRAVKGDHIIDPRTGEAATRWLRCWSAAPTAAVADALSTAFMVMTEAEIRKCCDGNPELSAYALRTNTDDLLILADHLMTV